MKEPQPRRGALGAEVALLAADPAGLAACAEVLADMDALTPDSPDDRVGD